MAFHFTLAQRKRFSATLTALLEAEKALQDQINEYNDTVREAFGAVQGKLEEFDGCRSAMHDLIEEVEASNRDAYDQRSEKWQEGQVGEGVIAWLDELSGAMSALSGLGEECEAVGDQDEFTFTTDGVDDLSDLPMVPDYE